MSYVNGKRAAEFLGVSQSQLRKLADCGKIESFRTKGGQRRYAVGSFVAADQRTTICYARVSSPKQRADLERQRQRLERAYPDAEVVAEIGSGLNFRRKGLASVLERAMRGERITLVVAERDRLARFGFALIDQIVRHSGGKIVVLGEPDASPEHEMVRDVLAILHVYSCRVHGLRAAKNKARETYANTGKPKGI